MIVIRSITIMQGHFLRLKSAATLFSPAFLGGD